MAIQGVKGNILELLMSPDKTFQDFASSLNIGDTLRGRVIEIIPAEQKAIINLKGFNIMAQLPENSQIEKGETLNLIVSEAGSKIFLKIDASAMGKLADPELGRQALMRDEQQIISLLNGLNVPVNEKNIFIATKLADYHIAINRENIESINYSLKSFMASSGIELPEAAGDKLYSARDIALSNFLRLSTELEKALLTLREMSVIMQKTGKSPLNLSDISVKPANMLKTALQYANESNGAITITADAKSMTMLIKGGTQADLLSALTMAVTSGSMTSEQAEKAFSLIESGKLAGNGGNMSITKDNAGIKFTIQGMPEMIETIALQAKGEAAGAMKSILYSIMESKVFTQNIIEMLPDISKAAAVQVRELNAALKNNVISPQNTDINSNIRQSAALLNAMHNSLENLVRQLQTTDKNFVVTRTNQGFLENFKAGISAVLSRTTRIISESGMKNGPENIHIKPADFQALRSSVMALTAETEKVFDSTPDKSMTFVSGTHTQVKPSAGQQIFDIESAIEAIVFLKSRNLPDTPAITGIMARYFKNDLKIGQTLEALNVSLARVEKSLSGDKGAARLLEAINGFKQAAANSYIKAGNRENSTAFMEQQLKAYIEKSGINLENAIYRNAAYLEQGKGNHEAIALNLKSQTIRLLNELSVYENADTAKSMRTAVAALRESAGDLLANISALGLMNQRPVSMDMAYTQIPVFLNSKLFNGEFQVWYRKDAPKHELNTVVPVNMAFNLNTSNMGPVRINMTVYRNEVECTVRARDEKAKQVLTRNRNELLAGLQSMKYNVKSFIIIVDDKPDAGDGSPGEGYVNLGNINLRA